MGWESGKVRGDLLHAVRALWKPAQPLAAHVGYRDTPWCFGALGIASTTEMALLQDQHWGAQWGSLPLQSGRQSGTGAWTLLPADPIGGVGGRNRAGSNC